MRHSGQVREKPQCRRQKQYSPMARGLALGGQPVAQLAAEPRHVAVDNNCLQ
jgi:hypothetical protein